LARASGTLAKIASRPCYMALHASIQPPGRSTSKLWPGDRPCLNCTDGGTMSPEAYISATRSKYECEWPDETPDFQSNAVGVLADHWIGLSATADGGVPYRHQIDPTLIGRTLSRVYIYELDDAGFVCRLAGERVSWNHDTRLKGRRLSDILDPSAHEMVGLFMTTCLKVPAVYRNIGLLFSDTEKREAIGERVFLPLRDDNGEIGLVIGVTDVDTVRGARDHPNRSFYRCDKFAAPSAPRGIPSATNSC
jgi:hypothetical protein